jgi:SAM-dependent methyltransferase
MTILVDNTAPINSDYGLNQGVPIARHYINSYIHSIRDRVSGRVLEFGRPTYAADLNCGYDILDIDRSNPLADIYADICDEDVRADLTDRYDYIICTAVLQLVADPAKAVQNMRTMIKPGGALILAEKCLSKIDSWDGAIDKWRFTPNGLGFLARDFSRVAIGSYGNVYSVCAYLMGLPHEQIDRNKLETVDPEHPLVAVVYAEK